MADQFNILDQGLNWFDTQRLVSGESTVPRHLVNNQSLSMTSGSLRVAYFTAQKSETITQVRVTSLGTAAGATPTLIRIGIWTADLDGALLSLVASTPNDTSLLAATNTDYAKALSASLAKAAGQRYGVGLLVVTGAAAPVIGGWNGPTGTSARQPRIGSLVGGQTDLPATIAVGALSNSGNAPYIELLP